MFKNKVILIPGGTGSWGTELTKQLLKKNPKEIRIYSRGEQSQVEMRHAFNDNPKLKFIIGDVRDNDRVMMAMRRVDYVFHLAALKHVPIGEIDVEEFVKTNILGTRNIIGAAIKNEVKKVILASTDKSCDPYNLYGNTKAVAEKLIISGNKIDKTVFACIRSGNVIGSSGSVIPLFHQQLKKANKITITDKDMTRYIITLNQAIKSLIKVAEISHGGEVFVLKMPSIKILDLAEVMIEELGNKNSKMITIGIRPGEKLDEVLVSKCESNSIIELNDFFIILPTIKIKSIEKAYKKIKRKNINEYTSRNSNQLSKKKIKDLLVQEGWLNDRITEFDKMTKEQLINYFEKEGWVKRGG